MCNCFVFYLYKIGIVQYVTIQMKTFEVLCCFTVALPLEWFVFYNCPKNRQLYETLLLASSVNLRSGYLTTCFGYVVRSMSFYA